VPILGSGSVPTTEDTLAQFLQHAGMLFGKDPTKWEKIGKLSNIALVLPLPTFHVHSSNNPARYL
jgi:hypothetical protein